MQLVAKMDTQEDPPSVTTSLTVSNLAAVTLTVGCLGDKQFRAHPFRDAAAPFPTKTLVRSEEMRHGIGLARMDSPTK
ncbi:MAG: hypothetical protein KatS3mg130_0099 [Candidatus Sumerlaea sp.]|uniref:Uncharacterized protein n=1 Tax=Sumerlaea chitinivorans TaxID=2250252 RepID=A0A2Z4Y855_SUMC1|nr:hypothetical protein BRCON_2695 [Candidatus Sumerlaea chitinivorans]GIX43691.1 MAG: hypothetical protein KatS3mg130_0099 [Candidatus Sumerlaea sp.]